jgi:hypothetical protein
VPTGTGLPTTTTAGTGAPTAPSSTGIQEQAADVADATKQAGGHVAETAKDQATNVLDEGKVQARRLMDQATTELGVQAEAQKQRAADGLRNLSGQLRAMADASFEPGIAADVARQASDRAGQFAQWIDTREPGQLLEELKGLGRRKPGAFLLGAAIAGALAGRVTRAVPEATPSTTPRRNTSGTTSPATGNFTSAVSAPPPASTVIEEEIVIIDSGVPRTGLNDESLRSGTGRSI